MTLQYGPAADSDGAGDSPRHPLLLLADRHLQLATEGLMTGRFNALRQLRDPKRMLVVYRKSYGADAVGDEYFVAEPTYITGPACASLRPGETIVVDFGGNPAVAIVEAMLYRSLLDHDDEGRSLVSRHLAHHRT